MFYCVDVWLEQNDLRLLAIQCCTERAKVAAALWYFRGGLIHFIWKGTINDRPLSGLLPNN